MSIGVGHHHERLSLIPRSVEENAGSQRFSTSTVSLKRFGRTDAKVQMHLHRHFFGGPCRWAGIGLLLNCKNPLTRFSY